MEHHGYARNTGAVFSLKYHLVFCPKHRKAVLLGPVAGRLTALLTAKSPRTQGDTAYAGSAAGSCPYVCRERSGNSASEVGGAVQGLHLAYPSARISALW